MRTESNYVQVRVISEEKDRFLRKVRRCGFTEKLTLYKMLHGENLRELPPEEFWEVDKQIGKIKVCIIQLRI